MYLDNYNILFVKALDSLVVSDYKIDVKKGILLYNCDQISIIQSGILTLSVENSFVLESSILGINSIIESDFINHLEPYSASLFNDVDFHPVNQFGLKKLNFNVTSLYHRLVDRSVNRYKFPRLSISNYGKIAFSTFVSSNLPIDSSIRLMSISISILLTGIIKGKWLDTIPALFEREKIQIDFSKRGFYKESNVFLRKIETFRKIFYDPSKFFKKYLKC